MSQWKNAVKLFDDHEKTKSHRSSVIALLNREKAKINIFNQVVVQHSIEVSRNRQNLAIIIEIIIHLAKLGAPFRGHREDKFAKNQGYFQAQCGLISKYVPSFDKFLKTSTFTYTHHDVQNELISLIASKVRNTISVDMIENGYYWSLIADETTDITSMEQMTFVVRYTDSSLQIQERFFGFWETPDTKSKTLFTVVGKFKIIQLYLK